MRDARVDHDDGNRCSACHHPLSAKAALPAARCASKPRCPPHAVRQNRALPHAVRQSRAARRALSAKTALPAARCAPKPRCLPHAVRQSRAARRALSAKTALSAARSALPAARCPPKPRCPPRAVRQNRAARRALCAKTALPTARCPPKPRRPLHAVPQASPGGIIEPPTMPRLLPMYLSMMSELSDGQWRANERGHLHARVRLLAVPAVPWISILATAPPPHAHTALLAQHACVACTRVDACMRIAHGHALACAAACVPTVRVHAMGGCAQPTVGRHHPHLPAATTPPPLLSPWTTCLKGSRAWRQADAYGRLRNRSQAEHGAQLMFSGQLASVVSSATRHLFTPDLKFERIELAERIMEHPSPWEGPGLLTMAGVDGLCLCCAGRPDSRYCCLANLHRTGCLTSNSSGGGGGGRHSSLCDSRHNPPHNALPPLQQVPLIILYDDEAVDPTMTNIRVQRQINLGEIQVALDTLVDSDSKQVAFIEVRWRLGATSAL
eukprot:366431-Chlamydomonas_euryale.AAC.26